MTDTRSSPDIVERLRKAVPRSPTFSPFLFLFAEAANEIERLRSEAAEAPDRIAALEAEVGLWKARVNEAAEIIEGNVARIDALAQAAPQCGVQNACSTCDGRGYVVRDSATVDCPTCTLPSQERP